MNIEYLINAIGKISDKYVLEYAIDTYPQKKQSILKFNTRWTIVACLAVVVVFTTLIYLPINKPDNGVLETKMHIFSSYTEFSEIMPNSKIVENLSRIEGVKLEIYGAFQNPWYEDATKAENFSHFVIDAKKGMQYIANIHLRLNNVDSAEKHIETHALTCTTEINGISVSYAYNADMEYWDSVVIMNKNFYNIHFYSADEKKFFEFLTLTLEK